MNRENLMDLCTRWAGCWAGCWAGGHDRVAVGRVTVAADLADPVPEIMRSFRRAEISESEKNALLSLVCDTEEAVDCCAETACVRDEWADEHEIAGDDD